MLAVLLALLGGLGMAGLAGGGGKRADTAIASSGDTNTPVEPIVDPQPQPEPTPEPQPEPTPEPQPEPTPEPTPEPEPQPEPTPEPEPQPEPTPEPEPQPEPTPEPEPQPEPTPAPAPNSEAAEDRIAPTTISDGDTISIDGGRVTTLEIDSNKDISSVEIISGPAHGNATVNPDNSIAMVLSGNDYSGTLSLNYKLNFADGTSATNSASFHVAAPELEGGWGKGEHYMLAEDANGDIIVETGDNHREIYISESDDALSAADIASLEGVSVSKITGQWLQDHPSYGDSENTPLDTEAGMMLWSSLTGGSNPTANSHWLMFEKGYTYEQLNIIETGAHGESELHPMHITSWGDGDRPILKTRIKLFDEESENIVFSDLEVSWGVVNLGADNTLFSDMKFSGVNGTVNVQHSENFTLHDSEVAHVIGKQPDGEIWKDVNVTGLFSHNVDGILIEGSIFHHNGWEDDYHYDRSTDGGQPPNQFSHNIYLQASTSDVTFRDNIVSQGASTGAQLRGGAYAEDNAFIDNNVGFNLLGGIYKQYDHAGNFSLAADNLVTSAGYKTVNAQQGALNWGIIDGAVQTSMVDNLVAHNANPNDPAEIALKEAGGRSVQSENGFFYNDTVVYNWQGSNPALHDGRANDRNAENVDETTANATTIQNFAASVLGASEASIQDLMNHLIAQADTSGDDTITADDIISYFQNGFNIDQEGDPTQTDHRFIPDAVGDGIRWDNRLNWDNEFVPEDGASVDLAGNWVQYGGTTDVAALDLGSGGQLAVNSGKLSVDMLEAGEDGGQVSTTTAGQLWVDGYTDTDETIFNIEGGRFANTGEFTGNASMHVTNGQAILATDNADFVLNNGSTLSITGGDAKVGFDGESNGTGVAIFADDSTISFTAQDGQLGEITEFRSGAFNSDNPNIQSGVNLGDAELHLDLSDLAGGAAVDATLIAVDEIVGTFEGVTVTGLGNNQDVDLTIDYSADTVTLSLSAAGSGSGQVNLSTTGNETDANSASALWDALTKDHGVLDENPIEEQQSGGELDLIDF